MATELRFKIWVEAPFTDADAQDIAVQVAKTVGRRTEGPASVAVASAKAVSVSKAEVISALTWNRRSE